MDSDKIDGGKETLGEGGQGISLLVLQCMCNSTFE